MLSSSSSSLRQRLRLKPNSLCTTSNSQVTHSPSNRLLHPVPTESRTSLPSLQLSTRATMHRLHLRQHLLHSNSHQTSLCLSPPLPSNTSSNPHNNNNNNNNNSRLVAMETRLARQATPREPLVQDKGLQVLSGWQVQEGRFMQLLARVIKSLSTQGAYSDGVEAPLLTSFHVIAPILLFTSDFSFGCAVGDSQHLQGTNTARCSISDVNIHSNG